MILRNVFAYRGAENVRHSPRSQLYKQERCRRECRRLRSLVCLSQSKGSSSSENLYPTAGDRAPVAASPPVQGAFCASRHRRHVLKGVSRPRDAVYPIATPPASPRSVHPVITAARGPRWRASGMKLGDGRGEAAWGRGWVGRP